MGTPVMDSILQHHRKMSDTKKLPHWWIVLEAKAAEEAQTLGKNGPTED